MGGTKKRSFIKEMENKTALQVIGWFLVASLLLNLLLCPEIIMKWTFGIGMTVIAVALIVDLRKGGEEE